MRGSLAMLTAWRGRSKPARGEAMREPVTTTSPFASAELPLSLAAARLNVA